jgi:proteasome lid subunit RPN8/RPN11
MIDKIIITKQQQMEMQSHINGCYPEEACGLLIGNGNNITEVHPITNILHSPIAFRMDPVEQYQALLRQETNRLDLLCIYHSHPAGPENPSEQDIREFAYPGSPYLIWSLKGGQWHMFGFIINGQKYHEIEIVLI